MSKIDISCIDQTLILNSAPEITSGDVNVDVVQFTLDDSWNEFTSKIAIFYRDVKSVYQQVIDKNNCAIIPREVLDKKAKIYIGIFGANGDKIKTSSIITYNIGKGAITSDLIISTPTPDVWEQILMNSGEAIRLSEETLQKQKDWEMKAEGVLNDSRQATIQCYDAISWLNVEVFDMDGGSPFTSGSEENDINGGYPS